jgi:hypothetical protein
VSLRSLMADNQRRAVLDALPAGGSLLEWGGGGTTRWLLERMAPDQRLVTVEHCREWAQKVASNCGTYPNWTILHKPPTQRVGENGTHWEECPAGLTDYVCPVPLEGFDVFLIDGVARGACLANVLLNARPGARVFLHDHSGDKRADWYSWAVRAGAGRVSLARVIEPDEGDYPTPMWACGLK